jgi:hypothetical protein
MRFYRPGGGLIVEDNIQERTVDVKLAVILDETQLLEFVHEEVYSRTRRANHFRQDLL